MILTEIDKELFWVKVAKTENSACWLWLGTTGKDGYGLFDRRRHGERKVWRAHRLAYELAIGPFAAESCVLHACDTPLCVNPQHLFLGNRADNARDMASKGRSGPQVKPASYSGENHWTSRHPEKIRRGVDSPNAKLTEQQVREIRGLHKKGWSQTRIAKKFGVHKATIQAICCGRIWSHLSLNGNT